MSGLNLFKKSVKKRGIAYNIVQYLHNSSLFLKIFTVKKTPTFYFDSKGLQFSDFEDPA